MSAEHSGRALVDAFSYQTVVGYAENFGDGKRLFRSTIEVEIESPGDMNIPENDNRALRIRINNHPGCGRTGEMWGVDLWVEDFDRLIAALQAAVGEARRVGVLPPTKPEIEA